MRVGDIQDCVRGGGYTRVFSEGLFVGEYAVRGAVCAAKV